MEGYQLIFYMKHIKTNAHRKGSDVAKEYDGQFRTQRLNVRIAGPYQNLPLPNMVFSPLT